MSARPPHLYAFGDLINMSLKRAKKRKFFMFAGRDSRDGRARFIIISRHPSKSARQRVFFLVVPSSRVKALPQKAQSSRFDLDQLEYRSDQELLTAGSRHSGIIPPDVRDELATVWAKTERWKAPREFEEVTAAFAAEPYPVAAE